MSGSVRKAASGTQRSATLTGLAPSLWLLCRCDPTKPERPKQQNSSLSQETELVLPQGKLLLFGLMAELGMR